jgi:hypothetical protein
MPPPPRCDVSKKHGAKHKHRKKARKRVLCASCRAPVTGTPWSLLAAVAAALNACADAGIKARLRHGGIIETNRGYVVRLHDESWGARTPDFTLYPDAAEAAVDDPDGMDE